MSVHVVVPEGFDDPARPSGGNHYDARIIDGLVALGGDVVVRRSTAGRLDATLEDADDGDTVVVDGLIATRAPTALESHARRLRLVALQHQAFGDLPVTAGATGLLDAESRALHSCTAVVATSAWTASRLVTLHGLDPGAVHVATPGTDRAPIAPGTPGGTHLLCVGALTPTKGQHVLLEALRRLGTAPWTCTVVGSTTVDPDFAEDLTRLAPAGVTITGAMDRRALANVYATGDLLVHPTLGEGFGMVVTEALARGLPIVASDTGGVPESLGSPDAGLLVPPGDPAALTTALRRWLTDSSLRSRMREAARARRGTLTGWDRTVSEIERVLDAVARRPAGVPR